MWPQACVLRASKDYRNGAVLSKRKPEGTWQGHSADHGFGPGGQSEGQKKKKKKERKKLAGGENKSSLTPCDPAVLGAGLNGSLCSLWGVADPAGSELDSPALLHVCLSAGRAWQPSALPCRLSRPDESLSSTTFSHKNIFRKYFSVHWAIVHTVFLYVIMVIKYSKWTCRK